MGVVEPVEHGLHDGGAAVEIDRRGQNHEVGLRQRGIKLRHAVVINAPAPVMKAALAVDAGVDLPSPQRQLLSGIARFGGSEYKRVRQKVGVAALPGAAGDNQDFIHLAFLRFKALSKELKNAV